MNKRLKKSMSIVALIFMALFAVSLILCCFDIKMLNGSIGFVALFTGFIGFSVFAVIKISSRGQIPEEKGADANGKEGGNSAEGETSDNATEQGQTLAADGQTPPNSEREQSVSAADGVGGEAASADTDVEHGGQDNKAKVSAEKKKGRKAL